MNFQDKMLETTADLRKRAAALATVAVKTARARAEIAAKRVETLKGPLAKLTQAGRELNKVARRHAVRFVKENSSIAVEAGKDVSALARTTYASLAKRPVAPKPTARKTTAQRKRSAARKAA
jgi:hypothetical protein